MSAAKPCEHRSWQTLELRDDALVMRVTAQTSAAHLVRDVCGSKATAARVLARGQLRGQDGSAIGSSETLGAGTVVALRFWQQRSKAVAEGVACRQPLSVLHHDRVLLAVDKPAGLLVHGDATGVPTLTSLVQAYLAERGAAGVPQAVQRLDVDTTGVVVFSLAEELQPTLDAQVAGHEGHKRYLAVVTGRLDTPGDDWICLRGNIARDRHDARRMRVGKTGKPALTRVRALAHAKGRALLLVELGSGRRHQIRVHLSHAGHPLLGDTLYGGQAYEPGLMLHAWSETITHPATGERLELQAPVPPRFVRLFPAFEGWVGPIEWDKPTG